MRLLLPAVFLTVAIACSGNSYAPACRGAGWTMFPDSLRREVVDVPRERDVVLRSLELQSLPKEVRDAVAREWIDRFSQLERAQAAGAVVWSFRYDKCPGCGWYREGYVAVRKCEVVYELDTRDTM
jgi:hypothetical protein